MLTTFNQIKTVFIFWLLFIEQCTLFIANCFFFSVLLFHLYCSHAFLNCRQFESRLNTCDGCSNLPRIHEQFHSQYSAYEKATMSAAACRFYPQFNSSNYFTGLCVCVCLCMVFIHWIKFSIHKSVLFKMIFRCTIFVCVQFTCLDFDFFFSFGFIVVKSQTFIIDFFRFYVNYF